MPTFIIAMTEVKMEYVHLLMTCFEMCHHPEGHGILVETWDRKLL